MSPIVRLLISILLAVWMGINATKGYSLREGMLYPRESETREVKSLDGVWNFRIAEDSLKGYKDRWFSQDLSETGEIIAMPVPSSYNDITMEKKIRDHVGLAWYDRTFFVPDTWRQAGYRIWLRFGSIHYSAQVWINGHLVMTHEIGHLPFKRDITSSLLFGKQNRVTVAVNNTLDQVSVPQGTITSLDTDHGKKTVQSYTFDFFNYAGIHRSVHLYTTPVVYIDDITVTTDVAPDGTTGLINYSISVGGSLNEQEPLVWSISLLDKHSKYILTENHQSDSKGLTGVIQMPNAKLWWPYLMHDEPGYMYTFQIQLLEKNWSANDVYRLPVGIRSLKWNNTSVTINSVPIYIRGFGRHEDSDIRGKGLDLPLVTRDYNLIKWIGANTYRTSHYPYAEEIMDFADQQGIMIIDECPAVDTENYSSALRKKHTESLMELIRRDKNRPSVIMWSIANEPRSQLPDANVYYRSIANYVKEVDKTRPITAAIAVSVNSDLVGQYLDVIGFNRYNAWYSNPGKTEVIRIRLEEEAGNWHSKHNKPIFMTEYGADTMAGLHISPSYVWSEEYQVELMSEHFKAFDNLRKKGFFIGEMIWNFADFNTAQTTTRVGGNRKGVFTRQRQPKASAHHLRKRYWNLAKEDNSVPLPQDIQNYVSARSEL